VCWKREKTGAEAMLAEVDAGPPPAARGPVKFPDGGKLEVAPDGRLVWTSKGGRRTVLARA
jgi:hypothetical protein